MTKEHYMSDIRLGVKYQDKDTGLVGTSTSIHFYKNACERVVLNYLDKNGNLQDASFDAMDLINVETKEPVTAVETGGPERSMPPRR